MSKPKMMITFMNQSTCRTLVHKKILINYHQIYHSNSDIITLDISPTCLHPRILQAAGDHCQDLGAGGAGAFGGRQRQGAAAGILGIRSHGAPPFWGYPGAPMGAGRRSHWEVRMDILT